MLLINIYSVLYFEITLLIAFFALKNLVLAGYRTRIIATNFLAICGTNFSGNEVLPVK